MSILDAENTPAGTNASRYFAYGPFRNHAADAVHDAIEADLIGRLHAATPKRSFDDVLTGAHTLTATPRPSTSHVVHADRHSTAKRPRSMFVAFRVIAVETGVLAAFITGFVLLRTAGVL